MCCAHGSGQDPRRAKSEFQCDAMAPDPFSSTDHSVERPERTSLSLIEGLRVRSPDAWGKLVNIYSPLIYRWCRRLGVAHGDAPDVCQEVFRSVLRGIGGFRRSQPGDSLRGWLYTIAQNKARDHLRRRLTQPLAAGGTTLQMQIAALANPDERNDVEHSDAPPGDDEQLLAMQILDHLRGEFGEAAMTSFWRMVVDRHAAKAIADDLGISPKAVRQAKFRVLRRLREELTELG